MAASLTNPKLTFSSPAFQSLYKRFPIRTPSILSVGSSLIQSQTLSFLPLQPPRSPSHYRRFTARAESENGSAEHWNYDFDLFTIGAGSGGVRASRFAANFGASVAVCELPFATISSETAGGFGGT